MDTSDRRKSPRINVNYPVNIVAKDDNNSDEIIKGVAVNISREGLGLKLNWIAPLGTLVSISLIFAGHDSLLLGEIIWRKREGESHLYGLKIKNWSYVDPLMEQDIMEKLTPPPSLKNLTSDHPAWRTVVGSGPYAKSLFPSKFVEPAATGPSFPNGLIGNPDLSPKKLTTS